MLLASLRLERGDKIVRLDGSLIFRPLHFREFSFGALLSQLFNSLAN
jgi:hypothetical protein